jgi:hypothetical protein
MKTLNEKIEYQSAEGRNDTKIKCRDLLEYKAEILNLFVPWTALGFW